MGTSKTQLSEDQEKALNKYKNSKQRGKLFLELLSEGVEKLKEDTGLNVKKMIADGNPNVGTAIIYNEGYKTAMNEFYSWITTD